jgi:ribonuclease BN (tRNA processing enzyme)
MAGGRTLMYTGDTGPSTAIAELAAGADLMLAEATHLDEVPEDIREHLSDAGQAGVYARDAQVGRLVLTHLWPGSDPVLAQERAARAYSGPISVAVPELTVDLGAAPIDRRG